jgi:hypothetical protein
MKTVKFRVTEITRYLARPNPRVKVTLAVSHAGQTPPFPVNGSMTLDLDATEAGYFDLDDLVGIAFEFE